MNKPFLFILLPFFWLAFNSFGQDLNKDKLDNTNALPLGPSRIHGSIVNKKNKAIKGAVIRLSYPDGYNQPGSMTITDGNGRFTAYVLHYHQPYVDLEIIVKKKIRKTIRYPEPGMGNNLGHPSDIIALKCRCRKS